MSSAVCLSCETSTIPATQTAPVHAPKRFTITRQVSKLNKARITVTDNLACITSSYSYTTAQELVRELANNVGMLAYTHKNIMEMLGEQNQVGSQEQEQDRRV